VKLRITIEPL